MVDGFSSADPRLARGPQLAPKPKKKRRSSRRSSQPAVIIKGGTVTINGQGFSVAPSLQAKFIQQKTGGSGSSAQAAIMKAQQLAQQEAQRLATAERLAASQRILALRKQSELINRGAKENIRNLKNREGQRVKLTWVEKGKEKIFTVKNLETGEFTVRQFKNGRRVSDTTSTGGVIGPSAQEIASRIKITKSSDPNRLVVRFPNGQRGTINSSGTVIVGARLAGNKYTFKDGVIIAVDNKSTYAREEFVPTPSVEAISKPSGFISKKIKKLNDLRKVKVTASVRNQQRELKNELAVLGVVAATVVIGGVQGAVAIGSGILKIIRDPRKITKVPKKVLEGGTALITSLGGIGQMIRVSPTEAIAVIGGEYILLRGTGSVLKIVGKLPGNAKALIRPALNKADKTSFTVSGNTIKLAGGTATTAESLAKQAARAGKKAVPVTALADDIFNLIKRKEIVRKPIPGQNLLSVKTRKLLKKFDSGKASKSEMIKLDRLIKIETKGAGSLLERATYADPAGRVRTSRLGLGIQKDASLLDIISGDFTFRANKPQIFVFDKVTIEAFPAGLKTIARKFKSGKTLTQTEADALLKFQLKKSGKWKPIGAVSKESEIVLSPGELIQRVKTVGHVNIGGQRIPVVKVKVVKSSGNLKTLLNKFDKNKISSEELRRLQKLLEKKTGFKNSVSRSGDSRPVARFPGVIGRRGRGVRGRVPKRTVKRAPKRTPVRRPPRRPIKRRPIKSPIRRAPKRPVRRVPKRSPKRSPKRPPKRPQKRPPARPPKKPPIIPGILPKQFKKKKLSKSVSVYYIKVKKRGKLVNLHPRPLQLSEAKDLLAWSEDRSLVRSGYFYPLGKSKQVVGLPSHIKNYFTKNKRKFRPHKIKHGVKKQILNGFIEKKKYVGDTKQEVRQLQASRKKRISKRTSVKRRQPTKKSNRRSKPLRKISRKIVKKGTKKKIPTKKKTKTTKRSKK